MSGADLRRLLLLAAIWGGSFIFIRVAAPAIGPIATVEARVGIGGLALLVYVATTRSRLGLRSRWRGYLFAGTFTSAIPFLLICTAELRLTASMGVILNATSPLFAALIAAVWLREPLTRGKIAGIGVAVTGIVVLVGWSPLAHTWPVWLSVGACLAAAASYGIAGAYVRTNLLDAPPLGLAVGSQVGSALLVAPALPFAWPHAVPSVWVIGCVLALSLLGTAFAYVLYFRLVLDVGPTRALTVTFLTPVMGVVWARLLLGEPITVVKVAACAIILAGTALVTGALPLRSGSQLPARELVADEA